MALKKRVEILFDPAEYRRLEDIAHAKGRSVGSVVREAVEKYVVRPTEEERRKAAQWIASQTFEDIGGEWEDVKREIIEERVRQIDKSLETD
ncbi:MAG: hypothetical protein HYY03_02020 [Chloroflexi bacterium]|nr:hypothetical protein [Chloroflexota bacterium]